MKTVTVRELNPLIDKVLDGFLTSNKITNRTKNPYFYNHPSVSSSLRIFKEKMTLYRMISWNLIEGLGELHIPQFPSQFRSLCKGTFAHSLVRSLAVSSFNMEECAEYSARFVVALLEAGFDNFGMIEIRFLNAKEGMERTHQIVAVNVPTPPGQPRDNSLGELFRVLPKGALIADPFLNLSFSPDAIPDEFTNYINAYGGRAEVTQFFHLYNFTIRNLSVYRFAAEKVEGMMRQAGFSSSQDTYDLDSKTKIEDTVLITWLREKTGLPFFGVRNEDYKVDAIVEVDVNNKKPTLNLQGMLNGYGRFVNASRGKNLFVLEGVNVPNDSLGLIQSVQSYCRRK